MALVQIGVTLGGNIKNFMGLSTDTKPTVDVGGGSQVYESDTSKTFIYDQVNINPANSTKWWEML